MAPLNTEEFMILGGYGTRRDDHYMTDLAVSTNEVGKFRTVVQNKAAGQLGFYDIAAQAV